MGKALYRKYRSKSFDEVLGQEHITDTLKNALKKDAISHAYLFTGPRGVGKTSIARILAHAVNNLDYQDESVHLDIIEIDAASNRRIDEIRDLREKVHIAPTSAKYKVYIIDEVHMLTREAFNALLKTLEEPPEHVIFILATTEAHKVPDTIISRTQRFNFKPIKNTQAIEHLKNIAKKEKLNISDSALNIIATHGKGSFRDSISILDQVAGFAKNKIEAEDVSNLLGIPSEELIENTVSALFLRDFSKIFEAVRLLRENGIDSSKAAIAIAQNLRNKMLSNELKITDESVIKLLKELLNLSNSSNDFLGLEIALLECSNANMTNMAEKDLRDIKTVDYNPNATEKAVAKPENRKQNIDIDILTKPKSTTKSFDEDSWKLLLDVLRKEHNTLYGILRMAEVKYEDDKIILIFNFGFHKKQVDSPKNTALISKYLLQYFGNGSFTTIVKTRKNDSKEKLEESTDNPQIDAQDDSLKSVSNIFGGAELLES